MLYLVEIANTSDGVAKAIAEQADITTARMAYHQTMASAMANPDVNAITVVVLTDAGNTVIQDYWARQVVVMTDAGNTVIQDHGVRQVEA